MDGGGGRSADTNKRDWNHELKTEHENWLEIVESARIGGSQIE